MLPRRSLLPALVLATVGPMLVTAASAALRGRPSEPEAPLAAAALVARTTNPPTPGNFTGYGFDQCLTPSQAAMDAWLTTSAYWAVGIYISGNSRHCRNQPNLTPEWVSTQLAKGWRLLPITLGPQAYCNPRYPKYADDPVIKRSKANGYAAAKAQGVAEATKAAQVAASLGIVPGSTLWYDLEAFDIGNKGCRASAMQFLTGWTEQLRRVDYVSGVYSSGASGIVAIDNARVNNKRFTAPDRIWVADWSGAPFKFRGAWLRSDAWLPGGRMHQYRGGHDEVHGGVRINIDSNFLDLGRGSVAKPAAKLCGGVRLDFGKYTRLDVGTRQPLRIKAAQCLLRRAKYYSGPVNGVYDATTGAAAAAYRTSVGLPPGTAFDRAAWTAALAAGAQPLLKFGSASRPVRGVQRALNAAGNPKLAITGVFESRTAAAVRAHQKAVGLKATGVVDAGTWAKLRSGAR